MPFEVRQTSKNPGRTGGKICNHRAVDSEVRPIGLKKKKQESSEVCTHGGSKGRGDTEGLGSPAVLTV